MDRRSRGEGSLYEKDGRWCGEYVDANGKTRYVYAKTEAITDKGEGIVYDAVTPTVWDYLDRWLASTKETVRERTWIRVGTDR